MGFFNMFTQKDINAGVKSFRETKNAILLDVRTREEYASGHIEGSRNFPLDEIGNIDFIIKDKSLPVYVHCKSGIRSAKATEYLKDNGYTNVHDIGGINSYKGRIIS